MNRRVVSLAVVSENSGSRDSALFAACKDVCADLCGVVGYAIVVWDRSVEIRSGIFVEPGPIGLAMVPTLAHDALNRHVSISMAAPQPISD
jgi:hypothetical protein